MDLLRYYFRKVDPTELEEILSDYEAHFAEGKKAGLTEEEICRELGSPKEIYEMYLHEDMLEERADPLGAPAPEAASEKPAGETEKMAERAERLAGEAGRIAGATLGKAQKAWQQDLSPRMPAAANTAGSLLWKILFSACYASGFLIILTTLFLVYLLSGALGWFSLPGLSGITLFFLAGTGLFAGLALIFAGMEIRNRRRTRQTPPSSGTSAGPSAAEPIKEDDSAPTPPVQPMLLLPAAESEAP